MRPREALLTLLEDKGLSSLATILLDNKRFFKDPFQETAVHMLVKNSGIEERGIHSRPWFLGVTPYGTAITYNLRGGDDLSDALHVNDGKAIRGKDLLPLVDEKPVIAIDLRFAELHVEKELKRLKLQVAMSLSVVREYLWDKNLALLARPSWLELYVSEKVLNFKDVEEMSKKMGLQNVILMDPNAEEELKEREIYQADAFIFGGIVDRIIPRKGLTSKIPCPNCMRRKVTLRGSTVGVPFLIHKLIEVVMKVRYDGKSLEEAIISTMGVREKRWRAAWEIKEAHKRGEGEEALERVRKWLGLRDVDLKVAIRMSGVKQLMKSFGSSPSPKEP